MLYFEILPDELLYIILLKSFKDAKVLSTITERLEYNYNVLLSLIKLGHISPDCWIFNKHHIMDTRSDMINFEDVGININGVDIDVGVNIYKIALDTIFNDNMGYNYYYNDGFYEARNIFRIEKSEKMDSILQYINSKIKNYNKLYVYFNLNCNAI
jgi:uncharacterized protein (DUF2164 family)